MPSGVANKNGLEPGPCSVRAGRRTDGQQRTPAVTEGSEESQLNGFTNL
jgi:hypothetical protein